jgi:eukaryotic-like serine/threonine-protein kinase
MTLLARSQLGSLEIVRLIGAGGMGEVYLALDRDLGRHVAVKVLHAGITAERHRLARLAQEARAASALSHPNICHIYHLGDIPDGGRYIAMEYVEGERLDQRLLASTLPLREVLDIGIQVASALAAAHAAGIIHRDIKPENVMIRRDGLVKVLDFGLAKLVSPAIVATHGPAKTATMTNAGALLGTIDYMSPEQARGREVDARSDIWSLGVVLYEMTAGRAPFTGVSRSDVLAAILDREPASLTSLNSTIPAELQRIVGKALRKDPEQRYQVMKDLLLDLEAVRDETRAAGPPRRPLRSHRFVTLAAMAILLVLTAAAWWAWQTPRSTPARAAEDHIGQGNNYPYTRLTFGPGLQTDPTFSPDGKFIAYASDRTGNFDIWVQALSGGSDPVQVTKSPAQDMQPAWSPNGSTLVYHSDRGGGGLFRVPAFGGAERRLTSYGSHPTWSADGSEILFLVGYLALQRTPGNYVRLHAVLPDGEPPHEILGDFLRDGSWRWVAPHPDGRISATGKHRSGKHGFFTVSRQDGRVTASKTVPLGAAPGAQPSRFQWNADGTLLYLEATEKGTRSLWRVRVDPSTLEWRLAKRLTMPAGQDVAATLSRDGTRVAFSQQHETSRIWVFPIDTAHGRPRLVGEGRPLTEDGAIAASPALSQDGRKLAYEIWRPGMTRSELWVVDLDSGARELLATDAKGPVWSRDGTGVAYMYIRREKQPFETASAYRPLGGTERYLTPWTSEFVFGLSDWMPDGRAMLGAYQSPPLSGGAGSMIALWPTGNPKAMRPERILTSAPEDSQMWGPRLSPNGRWMNFTVLKLRDNRVETMVAPSSGAPPPAWVRIAPGHDSPDKPRWTPDGKALVFVSKGPTSYLNVWATRFDPERGQPIGKPFPLTRFDSHSMLISPYLDLSDMSLSPHHLALTMLTVTGNVWMLEQVDR